MKVAAVNALGELRDSRKVAIIGGGPAGLMAAEVLSSSGHDVTVYEAMPTVARKFLMAGKSGLNITHAEDYARFVTRFGDAESKLRGALDDFAPEALRAWAASLGQETFIGTSGRVFPTVMKASPLLRAWLKRLDDQGVRVMTRHRWKGFAENGLRFSTPNGEVVVKSDATILALGGASWPRLGSDAAWVSWLREKGFAVNDFRPANCGFDVDWSDHFRDRFAGDPLKSVATFSPAGHFEGEFVVTRHGIEGSLVYAHSAALRDALDQTGSAEMTIDLAPGRTLERLARDMERHPKKDSLSNRLRKVTGLSPVKIALLREIIPDFPQLSALDMARKIKALPLKVTAPRPIEEAISSAGGVDWECLDSRYMVTAFPGLFVAGEMLDWEAPTGGYLLTACMASGRAAANGVQEWLLQS
jgi:uncharacterized flavoprotein (TIGR03862 family)